MKKFFENGWWGPSLLVLVLCIGNLFDAQRNKGIATGSNSESAETVSQDSLDYDSFEIISEDSLIYSVLPDIFYDPAFEMGVCKAPTEFPVIDDEENTLDASITATPVNFTEYYKKCFGKHKSDQVIITAVQTNEEGKLRWHIRVHKQK